MTKTIVRLATFIATVALMAMTAAAQADYASARGWSTHAVEVPANSSVRWQSGQWFGPEVTVETASYVDGHEMPSNTPGCSFAEHARGVVLLVNVCGKKPMPLRLRVFSADGRAHRVVIAFRRFAP